MKKKNKGKFFNKDRFSVNGTINEQAFDDLKVPDTTPNPDAENLQDDFFKIDFDGDFPKITPTTEPIFQFDFLNEYADLDFDSEDLEPLQERDILNLNELERGYYEAFSDAFNLMRIDLEEQADNTSDIDNDVKAVENVTVENTAEENGSEQVSSDEEVKAREIAIAELDNIGPFPGELSKVIDPKAIYKEVFDEFPEEDIRDVIVETPTEEIPETHLELPTEVIPETVDEAPVEELSETSDVNSDSAANSDNYDHVAAILSGLKPVENLLAGMKINADELSFTKPKDEIKAPEPEEVQKKEINVDELIESIISEQKAAAAKLEAEAKALVEAEAKEQAEAEEQAKIEAKADAIINDVKSEEDLNPDEEVLSVYKSEDALIENTRTAPSPENDKAKFITYYNDEIMDDGTHKAPGAPMDNPASVSELASTDTHVFETSVGIDDVEVSPADYAPNDDYEALSDTQSQSDVKEHRTAKQTFQDFVVTPVVSALAFITMKVQQSRLSFRAAPNQESESLGEEMSPDKAAKFYNSHITWLRFRSKLAFVIALLLVYISYGLPVLGALYDVGVKSSVCLILLLTSMISGIDIITSGIMSLIRRRPNANSLIAISALLCVIDAFIISTGNKSNGLPFCAIPALTIAFSLLGSVMNCRSNRIAFNTVTAASKPLILTAETDVTGDGITLIKSKIGTKDFVRRVEEAGPDETVYGFMAPYLIAVALVLSLIAAIVSSSFYGFAHILSGIFAAAAPVIMLLSFPLPFFISEKGLIKKGCTIAGWSGLYDIGKSKHIVISDFDLFPKGNVKIEKARILSGMNPEKVISYAGSIIAVSGSTLAPAFSDLMKKGKGTLRRVDEFTCHESGGLIAMVDGEQVHCGTAAFMQLMGIRLPQKIMQKSCVFVAVSGVLCGIFVMEYNVTDKTKKALYSLMSSNRHPIFAIRDFNITPQMLSLKFDIATDGFDFPAYPERYEISGAAPSSDSKPSAMLSREGLGPLVDLSDHSKSLYSRIRICVMLSVLCTVIGMLAMFVLAFLGKMSIVSALTYMLIWLIPVTILSFTIKIP